MRTKLMIGFASTALLLMGTAVSAETYSVDPAHTSLAFSVRHLGISNVRGHFGEFAGTIVLDQGAIKKADATMQVKSIDTGVKQRDDHLRSADFFDATKYPVITFTTKSVEKKDDQFVLIADFTIRGVTKVVRLPVKLNGPIKDQDGKTRIGLEGKLTINRKDYGMNFDAVLKTGVALVGEEVSIEVNIEAVQQSDGK
ncbi:MAG: polyisoprenoid-binding protein [Pirellulaceae bacterium]|nr:polyisoprenoid-binding protein [Pirellulaceae bacterium]